MHRSADYAIQGYCYQFHKTIYDILCASDQSVITVEGIYEDIDISSETEFVTTQCKYHEFTKYTLSSIYKPLLQMLEGFYERSIKGEEKDYIKYVLYAYFSESNEGDKELTREDFEKIFKSKNKQLENIILKLKDKVNIDLFLNKFKFSSGVSLQNLITKVRECFINNGYAQAEVDNLIYPNALNLIATLSIQHDPKKRRIKRREFLDQLIKIKNATISQWTLTLKTRKELLTYQRKKLHTNLSKNLRQRCFYFCHSNLNDFDSQIVLFIEDFLNHHHYKKRLHSKPPVFCLDLSRDKINEIIINLYRKNIIANDGYIGGNFNEDRFLRSPIQNESSKEFNLRILDGFPKFDMLNKIKCDDFYIIGKNEKIQNSIFEGDCSKSVLVELLPFESFLDIKYLLGISNVFSNE